MNTDKMIATLRQVKSDLSLPEFPLFEELEKRYPIIYLCGRSDSGKTTFLSALLGRGKDEFPVGTQVSTKTEYRFTYGDQPEYQSEEGDHYPFPESLDERVQLFKKLNSEGQPVLISLPEAILKNKIIVDVPGVFDFENSDAYIKKMMIEADVVFLLTQAISKFNDPEHGLIKEVSDAHIPLLILFTMADIVDQAAGITRKTLPEYTQGRLKSLSNKVNCNADFLLSANDYFKGKQNHGIDTIAEHLENKSSAYSELAHTERVKRLCRDCLVYIEQELAKVKNDAKHANILNTREVELWLKTMKLAVNQEHHITLRKINNKLTGMKKLAMDHILRYLIKGGTYKKETASAEERKVAFQSAWDQFWDDLQNEYPDFVKTVPDLPFSPSVIFKTPNYDREEYERIKKILLNNPDSKVEDNEVNGDSDKEKKGEEKSDKSEFKKEDLLKLGLNIDNAVFLLESYNYLETVNLEIDLSMVHIEERITAEIEKREKELLIESKTKRKIFTSEDPILLRCKKYEDGYVKLKDSFLDA